MRDGYLSEEWYPDYLQIDNKEFPSAPQTDNYRYYQVLFEGNNYYCYVEVHKDYNTKVVGSLSIDVDGPEEAVIMPAPCMSFDIDQDDEEILNQFLERYKDKLEERFEELRELKVDLLMEDLSHEDIELPEFKWPKLEWPELPTSSENKEN